MDTFLDHFKSYIPLSPSLEDALANSVFFRKYKKGELVHNADRVCTTSYFIQQGILRVFYLKYCREVSEYFCAEGEWTNSPRSFTQQELDIYHIDAIENTSVCCIQVHSLVRLFNNFPEMERYARLSMGTQFGHLLERVTSQRFTTAREKYEHFCRVYHDIYHRIPLGMVASYLGITPETLSRIRAEK